MARISLREVRDFKQRINPEERQGAYGLYLIRPFSVYLTYAALNLCLSANQVTVLQTLAGVFGSACLAFPSTTVNIVGLLLLQLGFILDNVDGEVARFRREVSVTGKYLDTIGHELVVPSMYFCLGLGAFLRLGTIETVVFGFLAGLSSLRFDITNMYHEAAQLIETKLDRSYDYYSSLPSSSSELHLYRRKNEESKIRMLFALFAYPAVMNIITVIYLLDLSFWNSDLFGPRSNLVYVFICGYGTLLPLRRAYTVWRIVKGREVEKKYISLLEIFRSGKGS